MRTPDEPHNAFNATLGRLFQQRTVSHLLCYYAVMLILYVCTVIIWPHCADCNIIVDNVQ